MIANDGRAGGPRPAFGAGSFWRQQHARGARTLRDQSVKTMISRWSSGVCALGHVSYSSGEGNHTKAGCETEAQAGPNVGTILQALLHTRRLMHEGPDLSSNRFQLDGKIRRKI